MQILSRTPHQTCSIRSSPRIAGWPIHLLLCLYIPTAGTRRRGASPSSSSSSSSSSASSSASRWASPTQSSKPRSLPPNQPTPGPIRIRAPPPRCPRPPPRRRQPPARGARSGRWTPSSRRARPPRRPARSPRRRRQRRRPPRSSGPRLPRSPRPRPAVRSARGRAGTKATRHRGIANYSPSSARTDPPHRQRTRKLPITHPFFFLTSQISTNSLPLLH